MQRLGILLGKYMIILMKQIYEDIGTTEERFVVVILGFEMWEILSDEYSNVKKKINSFLQL
jgi:hypothetical protein